MLRKFIQNHPHLKTYLMPLCTALVILIIGSGVVVYRNVPQPSDDEARTTRQIDRLVDTTNKQVLEMKAKGGYFPSLIMAKADSPVVLRITTQNSLDCSAFFLIKDLKVREELPINGITDIEIPAQPSGTTIKGWCVMAMYQFKIQFE